MARIYTTGFEAGVLEDEKERFVSTPVLPVNAAPFPTVGTEFSRSGRYCLKVSGPTSGARKYFGHMVPAPAYADELIFFRAYVMFKQFPNVETTFMAINANYHYLRINSSGTVKFYDKDSVITGTTTITLNTYYCFEILTKGPGGSLKPEARVDGVSFSSTTHYSAVTYNPSYYMLGLNINLEAATSGICYFDDVAVNNQYNVQCREFVTDPYVDFPDQVTYPGPGNVLGLRIIGPGSVPYQMDEWLNYIFPGDEDNYSSVSEVPFNDNRFIATNLNEKTQSFTFEKTGLESGTPITCMYPSIQAAAEDGYFSYCRLGVFGMANTGFLNVDPADTSPYVLTPVDFETSHFYRVLPEKTTITSDDVDTMSAYVVTDNISTAGGSFLRVSGFIMNVEYIGSDQSYLNNSLMLYF